MWSSVSATAKGIYIILERKLIDHLECSNTWRLCTSVGLDNTSINIRIRNSMETRTSICKALVLIGTKENQ